MLLKAVAAPVRAVGISTFHRNYEKDLQNVPLAKCALRLDSKNVTAVTMSQGLVTDQAWLAVLKGRPIHM